MLLTTVKMIQNIHRHCSSGEICDPSSMVMKNQLESGWLELFLFVQAKMKPPAKGTHVHLKLTKYLRNFKPKPAYI